MTSMQQTHAVRGEIANNITTHQEEHKEMEGYRIMPSMSDIQISNLMSENHFPEGAKPNFEVKDLLSITEVIIKHATHTSIVENILHPNNAPGGPAPKGDDFLKSISCEPNNAPGVPAPKGNDNFISPLSFLKSISCEMSSCKTGTYDKEIPLKARTEAIIVKLKTFSWEAKAVLALSAFALEYGDFWHFAQLYAQGDQLTKSVAILKQVSVLVKPETLKKRKATVEELNKLIEKTYRVTELIVKVEDLLANYDPVDLPTLDTAIENIPNHIYWVIATIVACAVKVARLTSDEAEPYNLSWLSDKIEDIDRNLTRQYDSCVEEKEVAKYFRMICRLIRTSENITEVIRALIVSKYNEKQEPVISYGSGNKQVNSTTFLKDVEGKYVFFYISKPNNVSSCEIASLENVHKEEKTHKFEIVWIAIVEKWTPEAESEFKKWRSKMPWYAVKNVSSASRRYLEKEWEYRGNSRAVLVNPQGKLQNSNDLSLIMKYEINFFAFLDIKVEKLLEPVARDFPELRGRENDSKTYFLFYGGTDEKVYKEFEKTATAIKKEQGIPIQFVLIGVTNKEGNDAKESRAGRFWCGMENLFFSLAHHSKQKEYNRVTKEVQRVLSLRKESAWAMLSRGLTLVTSDHYKTVSETLKEFSKWKADFDEAREEKSFGWRFREHHVAITKTRSELLECCSFEFAGNAPIHLDCPVCEDPMETKKMVRYNCCHPSMRGY